jgi:hypothetical protein
MRRLLLSVQAYASAWCGLAVPTVEHALEAAREGGDRARQATEAGLAVDQVRTCVCVLATQMWKCSWHFSTCTAICDMLFCGLFVLSAPLSSGLTNRRLMSC